MDLCSMDRDGNIRISVRHLVEFILRSGDLDERSGALPDPEVMLMGGRIHRRIQKSMGPDYQSEVSLSTRFPCDTFDIIVEGRADGIFSMEETPAVDEIKDSIRTVHLLEEPDPIHLAQAKCYACILALQNGYERVAVRMTYVQMDKRDKNPSRIREDQIRYFTGTYETGELKEWFDGVLNEYRKWAVFKKSWKKTRDESIHATEFPFPYREGQRDLAGAVYRTISREKELFIQAPTGVGKTLAVLFPAVKALGENLADRIFYLTARTIARTVALDGMTMLKGAGLEFKTVVLTAKEKICMLEKPACNPRECPYAKGHFDRINDCVYELITSEDTFTRERIEQAAREYRVCPFELSLDLSLWMDAVICDYNYVFHPRAYLRRFFAEKSGQENLFLIDEAHNLVDRGRDMYSASLRREDFLSCRRKVEKILKEDTHLSDETVRALKRVKSALEGGSRALLTLKRDCAGDREKEGASGSGIFRELTGVGTLPVPLTNFQSAFAEYLDLPGEGAADEELLDLYFQVGTFLDVCDRLDDCYLIYDEISADGHFGIHLRCMDPSVSLQECLDRARSTIFFSATLLPVSYYKQLLTSREDVYAVYAKSCFDTQNLQVMIASDLSTRYRERGEGLYRKIAAYVNDTVRAKAGNYMVFFPSYRMLEETERVLLGTMPPEAELISQRPGMREEEREAFLEAFTPQREGSLIGLCVMGSIFGEGIDLQQDRLIGAIVVGTGLPQVNTLQELLRSYSERRWGDGFLYAYLYPGMNRVLQAAGRVIRTESDRGVVVLLDERFLGRDYANLFPREWTGIQVVSRASYAGSVSAFWK